MPRLRTAALIGIGGLLCVALLSVAGRAAAAPAPPDPASRDARTTPATEREPATFDAVIERVGRAVETGEWKNPDWKPAGLQAGLTQMVEALKRATGREDLALPVELADVRPAEPQGPRRLALPGDLVAGRDVFLDRATRSVILADGNARIGSAEQCVIVARGAVKVAHGSRNVIIAGHYIHVSHDGNPARPRARAQAANNGSVLVSGAYVNVSHATDSVICGRRGIDMSFAHGVTFFNSPALKVSHQENCANVQAEATALAPPDSPNPLAERLAVTQVAEGDDEGRHLAVIRDGNAEVVVRPGQEIRNGRGEPLPGAEGWKLTFVSNGFALFTRGRDDAAFIVPPRN